MVVPTCVGEVGGSIISHTRNKYLNIYSWMIAPCRGRVGPVCLYPFSAVPAWSIDRQAVCTIEIMSSLHFWRFMLSKVKQARPLLERPLVLDLDHQPSQTLMQMRIVALCERGATPSGEKKHVPSSSHQLSHLWCKVPAEPIQQDNHALLAVSRVKTFGSIQSSASTTSPDRYEPFSCT